MREALLKAYKDRAEQYKSESERASQQSQTLSYARLAAFVGGALLSYWVLSTHFLTGAGVAAAATVLFLLLVKRHARVDERRRHLQSLLAVNENELKAQNGDLSAFDEGKDLINPSHAYSFDLDLFGSRSIFQHINRTASQPGRQRLADWFQNGLRSKEDIRQRQQAVADLAGRLDFRQEFLALGHEKLEQSEDRKALVNWLSEPSYYLTRPLYRIALFALPGLLLLLIILSFVSEPISWHFPTLMLLVNLGVVGLNLKQVNPAHAIVSRRNKVLDRYSSLLYVLEKEEFNTPILKELQASLKAGSVSASESIKELAAISGAFDNRLNSVAAIVLNATILWDLQCMFRLERWKEKAKATLPGWFEVLANCDALVSLGNFAYNHPEFSYPEVNEKEFVLRGQQMGHLLLDPKIRIDNDLSLEGNGQYVIITGANMAGKSTFLRTVGTNLVLAMMGAPVCAKHFEFHPMQLYTSVRATDSIQDNESYFYAELKRLQQMVVRMKSGERLFVILDEMLRGTNSRDKQAGSRGLIEQLVHLQGMGLIATHDLSLGTLKDEYPDKIRNMRFEIEIDDEQLHFDYKLQEGISQNLNATFLMKKMGILE